MFYLLQIFDEQSDPNFLFLAGIFVGFSFAIKYTGWLVLPYAAVALRGRHLTRLLLPAALLAAPWLIRNWIWVGNPLAPFFNRWFPNPFYCNAESSYLHNLRTLYGAICRICH